MNTSSSRKPRELELINGIGPNRAKILSDAGVRKLRQLAQSNAEELAGRFRGVTPEVAQEWIDEAMLRDKRRSSVVGDRKPVPMGRRPAQPSAQPETADRPAEVVERIVASGKPTNSDSATTAPATSATNRAEAQLVERTGALESSQFEGATAGSAAARVTARGKPFQTGARDVVPPVPVRSHRTFTVDVQLDTATSEIIGATVIDPTTGDALPTPLDGSGISTFIHKRLAIDLPRIGHESAAPAPSTLPATSEPKSVSVSMPASELADTSQTDLVSVLRMASIAELIVSAEYGYGLAVVLPPGEGEARIWATQLRLSGEAPRPAGTATCRLDPEKSTSTTIDCAPIPSSRIPSRIEIVLDLRVAAQSAEQTATAPVAAALIPNPNLLLKSTPAGEFTDRLEYWRNRSLAAVPMG